MNQGYTVYVSDEAKRKHEKRPKLAKRKKDCPSCEIKAEIVSVRDDIVVIDKNDIKGDKE